MAERVNAEDRAPSRARGEGDPAAERAAPRVAVDAFVKVAGAAGEREYVFRTRDLSSQGLFLYTKVSHVYPFKVGSTLALELYDYDRPVALKVVVARVVQSGTPEAAHYPVGFGVRIVDLDDEARRRLAALIERIGRDGAAY